MVLEWLYGGADEEGGESADKPVIDQADNSTDDTKTNVGASGNAGTSQPNGGEDGSDGDTGGVTSKQKRVALSKSTRLKGYMTFAVASAINYYAAAESDLKGSSDVDKSLVFPATKSQKMYAQAAAMVTIIISVFCVVVHFDRFTCLRKAWREVS
mmetsp:Transcript_35732/g.106631  ORF Transcript_35732/g.106631 Transcript_35732/m.106631 type:complete len:155 (-) Transcript_35732:1031-1495(-)|eukprot:CAMPEP_0113561992 /NCGR_PEP_ID=MMETSP0015_2-20120614/20282_1 /TAXON_ID=2838 /ORGANISM="Odontella" /LENGTH=154 /DNA_ID=CAMNT_0000463845 /DNA_START=148 /DNA_END=612 /DNA_ORIENTATION=+ /assembly_acc=CAM_ASM_000160